MTYNELLLQTEWSARCKEILQRDQYHCKSCGCLGYHNDAYYECNSAAELDQILYGLKIEGESVSIFVDKVRNLDSKELLKIKRKPTDDEPIVRMGNKLLYDFKCIGTSLGFWEPTRHIPIASDCIIEEDNFLGGYFNRPRYYAVTCSGPIDWKFERGNYGGYYIFKNNYFRKYIVRIEKRWPTGVIGDNYGSTLIGHIVISIAYQNCCVALFFLDKAHLDNNDNYLESPIIPKGLNIHHEYYIRGLMPWEYDNDSLITLCQDCHMKVHSSHPTPIYKSLIAKQLDGIAQICSRCGGSGYLPQYKHVEGGVCFKCNGEGVYIPDIY